ncbi:hypothetical protein ACLI1A_07655 [Flavobacterium sp. RHBU_3]|uniref:hypothetical protein n=1 Tax=Flavobacterium sp. RHBU_3 TaxID=3391184 RepID=UPI003984C2FD
MKQLFTLLLLFIFCSVIAQEERITVPDSWLTENPKFKNQGEQEDFWAWRLFQKEYKVESYERFGGEISNIKNTFFFGKISFLTCNYYKPGLEEIFFRGFFYPGLLKAYSLNITDLQELKFLSTSPTIKRFRFWLLRENFANPQVFFFELQNENATIDTSLQDFIKGAKLTFVKEGWIII